MLLIWQRSMRLVWLCGLVLLGAGCGDDAGGPAGGVTEDTIEDTDLCAAAACADGSTCDPDTGQCTPMDPCADANCGENETCDPDTGQCTAVETDPCASANCAQGSECDPTTGQCVTIDLCASVECAQGEACDPTTGQCVMIDLCAAVNCAQGSACDPTTGQCVTIDLCASVECPQGSACDPDTGQCVTADLCVEVSCEADEACDAQTGACMRLPCEGDGACRVGELCEERTCTALACEPDPENDTRATATSLGDTSQTLEGLSLCEGEEDWFSLTVPAFHTLTARLRFLHSVGDLNAALFEAAEDSPLVTAQSDSDDEELRGAPRAATRQMDLQVLGAQGAINRYDLELDIACTDLGEPNNTREGATRIGPEGASLEGLVRCDGDEDWFRLEAPAEGQGFAVRLHLNPDGADLDIAAYLSQADEPSLLLESDNEDELIVLGSFDTEVWLRVFGQEGALNLYDLEVIPAPSQALCIDDSRCDGICDRGICAPCQEDEQCGERRACEAGRCVDAPCRGVMCGANELCDASSGLCNQCVADANEPNNNFAQATGLIPGLDMEALSICADDEDWFRFLQPPNSRLYIRLAFAHSLGDIDATAQAGDNTILGAARSITDDEEFLLGASPEVREVSLRVYGYNSALNTYAISTEICGPNGEGCPIFTCDDGSIILETELCDQRIQCPDASDELPRNTSCPFDCYTQDIEVPGTQFCDGEPQCPNGADESCYVCADGQRLFQAQECNGYQECDDGSDEAGCPTFTCNDGTEIVENVLCDSLPQCPDGSDEYPIHPDCPYHCSNGQEIARELSPHCDGEVHCDDGSDEDCFICEDGQILSYTAGRCDGFQDCSDGSDEQLCPTCVLVPENSQLALNCPQGETIQAINFASYGTPMGSCDSGFALGDCHAPNTQRTLELLCLNRQSCTVLVNNNVFTDPCQGTLKSFAAVVTCAP